MYNQAIGISPWWGLDPTPFIDFLLYYWLILPAFLLGVIAVALIGAHFVRPDGEEDQA